MKRTLDAAASYLQEGLLAPGMRVREVRQTPLWTRNLAVLQVFDSVAEVTGRCQESGVEQVKMKSLRKFVRTMRALGRGVAGVPSAVTPSRNPSIGLALGGGFARGVAHIGVLKVLEEEGIQVRFVAGTSVGALIGAAYCSGVSAEELEKVAARVRFRDLARWTLSRYGFATNLRMIGFLNKLLKVKTFEELRIPLAVTATDFTTGEGVVFRSGPLADPVRASCAYPGVFLPVTVNGRLLVDGMLAHSLPTQPVRAMGAERVIAVNLRGRWANGEGPRHIFDVIGQCFSIAQEMNCSQSRQCADLVIEPNVTGYRYDDFEHSDELVRIGEAAARQALPEIRKWFPLPAEQAASAAVTPALGPATAD
ncbi:MAG TPA: patatin-like phospholipase family protein [Terriglobales bacterium]|nr:patatin-like phospholipase family protein [Terriglobales bacterium]